MLISLWVKIRRSLMSTSQKNSGAEFLGVFQDRVCERGVPTKLIADNDPYIQRLEHCKILERPCCFDVAIRN